MESITLHLEIKISMNKKLITMCLQVKYVSQSTSEFRNRE